MTEALVRISTYVDGTALARRLLLVRNTRALDGNAKVMNATKTPAIFALLLVLGSGTAWAQKKANPPQEDLGHFMDGHFAGWDHNHDGFIDLAEVDRKIEDHSVLAREAAVIVRLRQQLTAKGKPSRLSRQQVLALAKDKGFQKSADGIAKRLETIDRDLFLPSDPDLSTFHQGGLGDCWLLAAIAAEARRNPKAIRGMIHPLVTGGFQIAFANGQRLSVSPLTDAEMLMGASMDSRHGSWLAVLEKAFGIIRRQQAQKKDRKSGNASQIVPDETLNGGCPADIMPLLTGRQSAIFDLNKGVSLQKTHNLLVSELNKRRMVCINSEADKLPPGVGGGHCYAIFGYDARKRIVTIFNPWGNNFTPKGPAGLANGYPVKNGVFTVPLDQFQHVFTQLSYETGKPAGK
jgi:hypothetical protein